MKLVATILGREWAVVYTNDRTSYEIAGVTYFPNREIVVRTDHANDDALLHIITHEVTHAYLYELGRGQDIHKDGSFIGEFICEFMAIHGKDIVESSQECLKTIKAERKRRSKIKQEIEKGLPNK